MQHGGDFSCQESRRSHRMFDGVIEHDSFFFFHKQHARGFPRNAAPRAAPICWGSDHGSLWHISKVFGNDRFEITIKRKRELLWGHNSPIPVHQPGEHTIPGRLSLLAHQRDGMLRSVFLFTIPATLASNPETNTHRARDIEACARRLLNGRRTKWRLCK